MLFSVRYADRSKERTRESHAGCRTRAGSEDRGGETEYLVEQMGDVRHQIRTTKQKRSHYMTPGNRTLGMPGNPQPPTWQEPPVGPHWPADPGMSGNQFADISAS